ncbi:MAG: DUF4190 domain-containing protein [Deltaproteobacteria bacterium]|nr:DUF4190 domain-containing protein [Deltaproteobacteria bacterium]
MTDELTKPPQMPSPMGQGMGPTGPTTPGASGKAIAALVLGIVSLICCGFLTGIPAIFVGRSELNAIREGRSPAAGESVAKIGYILGIIGTVLTCLATAAYAILVALGVGAGIFEELQKQATLLLR